MQAGGSDCEGDMTAEQWADRIHLLKNDNWCAIRDIVTVAVAEEQERIAKKVDLAAQKYAGGSWAKDLRELATAIRKRVKP